MYKVMKEKLEQINQSINTEKNRLMAKTSEYFDAITLPTEMVQSRNMGKSMGKKTPGLTYILYVIALVFLFLALFSDGSTFVFILLAAICAIGGYMFSKKNTSSPVASGYTVTQDINSIKAGTISKGIDYVKKITHEWEEFMEKNQKEVYAAIDSSPFSMRQKDELSSMIFTYEVIDINLSDLMSLINSASSIADIQHKLNIFKSRFLKAIDTAANNQEKKYRSLIGLNFVNNN